MARRRLETVGPILCLAVNAHFPDIFDRRSALGYSVMPRAYRCLKSDGVADSSLQGGSSAIIDNEWKLMSKPNAGQCDYQEPCM